MGHGIASLAAVQPLHVAAWVGGAEALPVGAHRKLRLAAIRHLFDWLVTGQVMPVNPAAAVGGPKHVVRKGKTPVLDAAEVRQLLDSIGRDGKLTGNALHRIDALDLVRKRAAAAGIMPRISNHSFRATGITVFRKVGGSLENAALMANHASTRTTQRYDRKSDEVMLDEIERIRF